MTTPAAIDQQLADLKVRIDEINSGRRRIGQSVNATGISLHRVLDAGSGMRKHREDWENWPRPAKRQSHFFRRVCVVLLLLAVVVAGAFAQRRWPVVQASRGSFAAAPAAPTQPAAFVGRAAMTDPFVIHVRAMRPCSVRMAVDGAALDWRPLQEGDEFFFRPRQEMFIQTTDGGALSTTVNGKPISLGADGRAVTARLTPDGLVTEPLPQR